MAINAGDASWDLVVVPQQGGLGSFYRAWLVLAAVLLVFGAVLAYMWASLRHALRLETANSRILELAQTDLLTNLANRRAFTKRLTMAFTAAWRGAPPFAVLYLDIDNFKDVNDTLGHAMGDLLLKEVVNRLRNAVRADDLVARFGGDEFAILLTEVSDPATAEDLAARIARHLAAPFSIKGHKIRITSSIGIALYSPEVAGAEAMMMQADLALYGAKDDGRNCYRFHSQDLDLVVRDRVRVADELRLALDQGELELYYQPQVELSTGRIIGLEALIRWNHKTRGLLTPAAFISIAERTGAILPLGRWIFDAACQQLKLWHAEGIAPPVLSVNVSGVQFKSAAELEREVEDSLSRWNINPGDIELELTESVLMEATQRHSNTLQNLRQLGVKIAIDDFGTGYSSLKYLTQYPVNRLKLAQEFVFRVTVDYRNAAVVRAAIRLANELGLEVIAEGVETEAQMRFLLGAGCEQAQGYFFSRPVTAQKATELLRAGRIQPATGRAARLVGGLSQVSEIGVAQRVEPAAVPLGRAGSLASIAIRCWRRGWSQILVERSRKARRAPPLRCSQHPYHRQPAEKRCRHHISRLHQPARFQHAVAIDADLAGFDQPRGAGARLGQPRAPEPFVETLTRHRSRL